MLTSVYLKDFRRHASLNMPLVDGLNGLFGSNYAGKTSVLLAVAVALGGAGVAARGWRLVRRGASNFEIQLGLQLAGKEYRVLRTSSGAKLWCGEKLLATGHGPVNAELGSLIGMPVARWIELRFVRQKAAAAMFEAGAAKLNQLVEELTGVTTVSRVIQQLQKRADQAKQTAEALREISAGEVEIKAVADRVAETETKVEAVRLTQQDLPARLGQAQADKQAAAARQEELAKQLRATHRLLDAHDSFERDLARLKAAQQRAAKDCDPRPVPELEAALTEAEGDQAAWNEWVIKIEMLDVAIAASESEIAKLPMVDPAAAQAELEAAQADVAAKAEAWEQNALAGERLGEQVRQGEDAVVGLRKQLDSGVCHACNRPFDGQDDEHRASLRRELGAAVQRLGELREQMGQVEAESKQARALLKDAKARLKAAEAANVKAAAAGGQRQTLLENLQHRHTLRDELVEQAQGCNQAQGREQLAECKAEVAELKKKVDAGRKLAEVDAQMEALQAPDGVKADLEAQAKQLQQQSAEALAAERALVQREAELRAQVAALADQLSSLQRQLESDQAWLERQDELASKLIAANRVQIDAGELVKYLRSSRSRYLANAWELIMGRASSFADAVTNGAISGLLRTEDGQFKFMEGEEEAGVDEASGAQAAILGLGVQIALAETLPTHLDLLLVDEPTADMDAEHSAAAVLALSTCAKQVVAISHHRMDESLCNQATEL